VKSTTRSETRSETHPASGRLVIDRDGVRSADVIALLEAHLDDMRRTSPPGSVHALDVAALRAPQVSFWVARDGGTLAGCAALKRLDATHAEIKSMRTDMAFRGRGVARALLHRLMQEARTSRGCVRLSLETGSQPFFAPARALYLAHGFEVCPPFGGYRPDPASTFMTRTL